MKYIQYKRKKSSDEYFSEFERDKLHNIESKEGLKEQIYNEYLQRFDVYNRDNFTCQNKGCKYCHNVKEYKHLTIHHVKHRRNGGRYIARNLVLICRPSHDKFNSGKHKLTFDKDSTVPERFRGHSFILTNGVEEKIDWKKNKVLMKDLRREIGQPFREKLKNIPVSKRVWYAINLDIIPILMIWLYVPYWEIAKGGYV